MNDKNLIKAMRETMRCQSQVITNLRQQIESLKGVAAQDQSTPPTHSWGKITEVDGGFNGDPETVQSDIQYVELHQWRRIDIPKQSGWFDDTKQRSYHTDDRLEGRTVYVKKVDDK
jgi:hypothetical protein